MAQQLGLQMLNAGRQLVQGSAHVLAVQLTDISDVLFSDVPSGTPIPLDAPATVNVTYTTPSGQTPVNAQPMVGSGGGTGYFSYMYLSSTTDETGVWRASFTATNGSVTASFPLRPAFWMVTQ